MVIEVYERAGNKFIFSPGSNKVVFIGYDMHIQITLEVNGMFSWEPLQLNR